MMPAGDGEELRPLLRDEPVPDDATLVIRGGPDNLVKLAHHAARTRRAYVLDGEPLLGVSVFLALDGEGPASLSGLLVDRMQTYRVVHMTPVAAVRNAGFGLLATFTRPHYTLVVPDTSEETLTSLMEALGPETANPYHVARRRLRREDR